MIKTNSNNPVVEMISKPLMQGAISAVGSYLLPDAVFNVGGKEVNKPLFYGLIGIGSELVSETLHQAVLKQIPHNQKWEHTEALVVSGLISGAVYGGATYQFGENTYGSEPCVGKAAVLGVGSNVATNYGYDNFVHPMLI